MKKILAICMVVVSLNAVAANHMAGQGKGMPMMGGATGYMHNLTPEQQKEFQEMMRSHMKENRKIMLDMKFVDLDIERELFNDKPDMKKIDRLIDLKSKHQAKMYKNMIRHKVKMKEKFGIEMMGGMMKGNMMMGPMGGTMMMQGDGNSNPGMSN